MGSVKGLTRRRFLESIGVAAGGLVLPSGLWLPNAQAEPLATAGFGSGRALRAAMHVHGSWSEGDLQQGGSWEAQLFQAAVRSMDSVGRYGGEEFLFVFPNTPLAQGISVCERVQDLVRSYDWTQIHPRLVVTLSIGVACEPLVANHEKLISVADEQLYRAKHSGRNQICAALPD